MSNKNFASANGKGYYIALALCALAIGVSGYLYYANANDNQIKETDQQTPAGATEPQQEQDVPVAVIKPEDEETIPSQSTAPSATTTRQPMKTAAPVEGETVVTYAMDALGYNPTTRDWRVHNGVDIAADEGTEVLAAADGTVYTVYEDDTMGMTVVIRHEDGYVTKYASLAAEVAVAPGDTVKLGQKIGTVGETALLESAIGCHVHFSVTHNDEPMDPSEFLALG